jgi:hypothetical protein
MIPNLGLDPKLSTIPHISNKKPLEFQGAFADRTVIII